MCRVSFFPTKVIYIDMNANAAIRLCRGFLGLQCGAGLQCVDDPRDDCDPKRGGFDCMGICVETGWPEMKKDGSWKIQGSD